MQKYIKKNIEVQAVQYDGMPESLEELTALGLQYRLGDNSSITIATPRGEVTGEIGDYILMSVTGDFEICNQDKFQKLYSIKEEPVGTTDSEEKNETENNDSKIKFPGYTDKDTAAHNKEMWERGNRERLQKYFAIIVALFIFVFMSLMLPFFYNRIVKKTIKTTVEYICREEIERESKLLLEKTKLEANQIIEQAKEDAKKEADEAFRRELERLTNERVKK